MIWMMLEKMFIITHSLRCWVTGLLEITSKNKVFFFFLLLLLAIDWAYELLVDVWKLDPSRLYATYFEGDEKHDLAPDLEARDLWLKYLDESHVIKGNKTDNFWEMGDTGPCGPCSEIHYDRIGGGRNAADLVNKDDPDVLEIWNLVFMEFNRKDDGSLVSLPCQNVDTGMGFERIVSVIHDKRSNYDTEIFTPIFEEIQKQTGAEEYGGKVGPKEKIDTAYRVVADHIRTLCVSITDGSAPGPVGRQYVVRRIMRRALRYWELLGGKRGGFCELADVTVKTFGGFFPELLQKVDHCKVVIKQEEDGFARTLKKGTREFDKIVQRKKNKKTKTLTGEDIWTLWSRFGFPPDLSENMAEEIGYKADMEGFNKIRSTPQSENSKNKEKRLDLDANCTKKLQTDKVPITDDSFKFDAHLVSGALVLCVWDGKEFVKESGKKEIGVILDKTNFYAEGGGQVADVGEIEFDDFTVRVVDTRAFAGFVLHTIEVPRGKIVCVGSKGRLFVDMEARIPIMTNHTCTHILNHALLSVLGEGVNQKGSLVDAFKLRFDFSYNKNISMEEINKVETQCMDIIKRKLPVYSKVLEKDTAMKIKGLRAVFANYPKNVRVITIGKNIEELENDLNNPDNLKWSIELCGGTHMKNSSEAELLVITQVESVAQGIKRATAVTGSAAEYVLEEDKRLDKKLKIICELEDGPFEKQMEGLQQLIQKTVLPAKKAKHYKEIVDKLVLRRNDLKRARRVRCREQWKLLEEKIKDDKNVKFVVTVFESGSDRGVLSDMVGYIKECRPDLPGMVVSTDQETVYIMSWAPKGKNNLHCGKWITEIKKICKGKGGGSQWSAQGSAEVEYLKDIIKIGNEYGEKNTKK